MELAQRSGVLRARELAAHGLPRHELARLVRRGLLRRSGRGLYTLADAEHSDERVVLAGVAKRVPHGIVCLLSALRIHNLTARTPSETWLAIDRKARRPRVDHPPIRVVRFSGAALASGIENHDINGVTVPVFSVAKTVADCFKYRNMIGIDVALEALRKATRGRRATLEDVRRFASVCRVANVIKPYLEAIQ